MARVGSVENLTSGEGPKGAATAIVGSMEIYLPLGDMVNLLEERARLSKETSKVEEELARIQKKLSNPQFLSKAKEEVIQKEREKSVQHEERLRALNLSLERLREIE
jgi:valyl-tRNA synthetase